MCQTSTLHLDAVLTLPREHSPDWHASAQSLFHIEAIRAPCSRVLLLWLSIPYESFRVRLLGLVQLCSQSPKVATSH